VLRVHMGGFSACLIHDSAKGWVGS
jgi:hypothetical protein